MKKLLLLASISVLFWGCDDETQPSGGGQARIIVNCPAPNQALGESFSANTIGGILITPGSTDLFSVTKGQNVTFNLQYQTLGTCKNVEVKFELNGTIVETRNYSMGGYDLTSTCPDGWNKPVNFIVP
jgi:hypothetical protein